jgi:hypothetical protein
MARKISTNDFNEGIRMLSRGKVVRLDSENNTLEDWLDQIGFNIDEDLAPFGYFFPYRKFVAFDEEEIHTFLDLNSDTSERAEKFLKYKNITTEEYTEFVKSRVQTWIESGDYPLISIGTITDGKRTFYVGFELSGHSFEGVRNECLGLFNDIDEMLGAHFEEGVFEPLFNSLDEFNSGT